MTEDAADTDPGLIETTHPVPTATTRSRKRRRLFAAVLCFVLLLVTLLLGEVVVRVYIAARGWTPNCYAGSLDLFRPHDEMGYDLRPDFRLKSGVWSISVNSQGFRGPEIPLQDNEDATRIAMLGGSSVFGYLVSDGQEAARLLEARLREGGHAVDVINAGVPGYNLFQTTARFRDRVSSLDPRVVVIYLGWNDLGYIVSKEPAMQRFQTLPVAGGLKRLAGRSSLYGLIAFRLLSQDATLPASRLPTTSPSDAGSKSFRANLELLLHEIEKTGATAIVCAQVTVAHPDSAASLHSFLGETDERKAGMIELGNELREMLSEVAQESGVRYVDMNEHVAPNTDHLLDYVHLSVQGEAKLAAALETVIDEELDGTK